MLWRRSKKILKKTAPEKTMFSSENHEGRLVELCIESPFTEPELEEFLRVHVGVLQKLDGDFIVAVDLRQAHVFPPGITERFIGLMSQLNPRLLRSAMLINESAILGLQAERAIMEAGHPDRRTFRDTEAMIAWLREVLTDREARRLGEFLCAPRPRGLA